jgi:hypothetical protein
VTAAASGVSIAEERHTAAWSADGLRHGSLKAGVPSWASYRAGRTAPAASVVLENSLLER